MSQSLSFTTSVYSSVHYGIDRLFNIQEDYKESKLKFLHFTSILLVDNLILFALGADGWLHEDYHRSVLTRNHVDSFDDMNTYPLGI